MLQTSARLLRLLSLLQSRRHWSGSDLSERLQVGARTIRRDIDRLRELGYPITASTGISGGYSLGAGSAMPPMLLEDDEAVAVAVALRAAAGSVGKMEEAAIGVLAKLDQILPARLRKRASALHAVTLSLGQNADAPEVEMLTQIATACRDHKKLHISYQDRGGQHTQRTVEPLRLAHTGRRWYLIGWDVLREDWRTLRVDRIQQSTPTGSHFVPRTLPEDPATFVSRSISYTPDRNRIRLRLKGSAEHLAQHIPIWCGVLEAENEHHCILNAGSDCVEGLVAQMASTATDFEILGTHEFSDALRTFAERLYKATR